MNKPQPSIEPGARSPFAGCAILIAALLVMVFLIGFSVLTLFRQFNEIAPIRAAQKTYMRSNGKLPDFIEVGSDVWFQVYDWHVRWQHPLEQGRDAQGRLTMAMNNTLIILRPDALGNFVGLPYDAR